MWNPELYQDTLDFAAGAHEGQFLSGKTYSYIVHLASVCMEVMRAVLIEDAEDPNLAMQVSLLQDTLEDTAVTYEILKDRFGKAVAEGVRGLTLNPEISGLAAVEECLERTARQKKEIWMVALSDRITGLQRPPAHWDMEKRLEYYEECRIVLSRLKKSSPYLASRLEDRLYAYKQYIE